MGDKIKINKDSRLFCVIKGCTISFLVSAIALYIYASLLANTGIQESSIRPVIMVITGISILIGSTFSSFKINKNGILNGICVGGTYLLILYILSSVLICGFSINAYALGMIGTRDATRSYWRCYWSKLQN